MPHAYGYRRDLIDPRDLRWTALPSKVLARNFTLRERVPFVFDQSELGSCVANGTAMALLLDQEAEGEQIAVPSRLGLYYSVRDLEHTIQSDAGASIRDMMRVIAQTGYGLESDWPYQTQRYRDAPPPPYYHDAATRKAVEYRRVPVTLTGIKTAISDGFPVVAGCTLHESFESLAAEKTGKVPLPKRGERVIGGHCTLIIGWDDDNGSGGSFEWLNSWSASWGDQGRYFTPQAFATKYGSDFWTVTKTSA